MLLLNRDIPVLRIHDNGTCDILTPDLLPFALRKASVSYADFFAWASNRALSVDRNFAKEILNSLRLSQTNHYEVFRACRGLSLQDSFWIREEEEEISFTDVSLFRHAFPLVVTEISLSGESIHHPSGSEKEKLIHTPELTTMGVNAKAWIRHADGLYLHKVGIKELAADAVLTKLQIPHLSYRRSGVNEVGQFLTKQRAAWISSVGEAMVCSKLFTSEEYAFITFEEFEIYCNAQGRSPYEEAKRVQPEAYDQMQIADYLLNNVDRHKQNWGFLMDNRTGELTGYCPLFDHDRAFSDYSNAMSQTTERECTLFDAAKVAQSQMSVDTSPLFSMQKPDDLPDDAWEALLERALHLG